MLKKFCTVKEASKYTTIAVKTLYEWCATGKIPSIKIGRRILFDLADIDSLMANLKRGTGEAERTAQKILGEVRGNGV